MLPPEALSGLCSLLLLRLPVSKPHSMWESPGLQFDRDEMKDLLPDFFDGSFNIKVLHQ